MKVWNDETTVYVTYRATAPWCITATHLAVAESPEDIPQTRLGNPVPGQFEFSGDHDCVAEVTYEVDAPAAGPPSWRSPPTPR